MGAIQRRERHGRVGAIGGAQGVVLVELVGGIERVIGNVASLRIGGVVWIEAVPRVGGISGRGILLGRVQRVVRPILIGRAEDMVIARVLFVEARIGKCWYEGKKQREEKERDNPHGEPPKNEEPMDLAYSPPEEERKQDGSGQWLVGGGSARPQCETHEGPVGGLVGVKRQMQTIRATARPATKEKKANQQGHSEENPDNVFHRDTLRMVKIARSTESPTRLRIHGKKRLRCPFFSSQTAVQVAAHGLSYNAWPHRREWRREYRLEAAYAGES